MITYNNGNVIVPTKSDYLLLKGQIKNGIEMRCGGSCACTSCSCGSCSCTPCRYSPDKYVTRKNDSFYTTFSKL
jgi:hypothetical protein